MTGGRKILVTGANGQLGSELKVLSAKYPGHVFYFAGHEDLSITDETAVNTFFKENRPAYCVNCAAYTAVDKAEDPAELALVQALNADAVGYLAQACTAYQARLIHISTDYVFDGNGTTPYKEDDVTAPVSIYGITKLKGEENAQKYTDAVIIRTAWVYSSFGKNFVKTMLRLMGERPVINVVSDQQGTPTYAADLAAAILEIISSGNWVPGVYHYTNNGQTSWYGFAVAIKEIIQSGCEVNPIPTSQYPTPAKRPAWSVLDKTKIRHTYQVAIPDWRQSLEICLSKLMD